MIEGSVLYSLSVSFLLPSCEEIPPESLPAFDTISSPKSNMPASEPFISKGTVENTSNCEFLLKIYHFPSFWKSLSSTKLTYTPTLSAIYALTISDRGPGSLTADVSENTLPFVSQSINNFSDYDISQSVDWGCPPLSPHVLLVSANVRQWNMAYGVAHVKICFKSFLSIFLPARLAVWYASGCFNCANGKYSYV